MQKIYSSPEFEALYTYSGTDLGCTWRPEAVFFRLWAPISSSVSLRIYQSGNPEGNDLVREFPMSKDVHGTWIVQIPGNWHGYYYTYLVCNEGRYHEVCDPYARTTGVNGHRAMILDLCSVDPSDWESDRNPHQGESITDQIIYEVHIRDVSIHKDSGIINKGKYIGLAETGTALPSGIPTGLSHIKALGVTYIQLMPIYDFGSVDESRLSQKQYNWGYDPVNYNVPEGSYATDPYHGEVRVRELKQMILTLHQNGFGVIMDVVYNHVYDADSFCFNRIVPGYFSRPGSNGSGCGNDTASERSMVRKYIADSVLYWVEQYHMDGFRFDLAGLIDAETIRTIMNTVHSRYPNVLFYGEGWDMPTLLTKPDLPLANQSNSALLPEFGFFNDSIRDLLRGSVFDEKALGYATGDLEDMDSLRSCFMGVTPWACSPGQSINYVSCHDNHTLFDRLALALPKESRKNLVYRTRLAAAFSILSQGVPFFLMGEEILRSKPLGKGKYEHNSYKSSDLVNAISWSDLNRQENRKNRDYYTRLIAFRKAHPCLRLNSREEVLSAVKPLPTSDPNTLSFRVRAKDEKILIIFYTGTKSREFTLPDGLWLLHGSRDMVSASPMATVCGELTLMPLSTTVLVQKTNPDIIDVSAAFICKNNKFLICQVPDGKNRAGLWEFPGGKRESHESAEQALIRECREELGITVKTEEILDTTDHYYPDAAIRLTLIRCTLSEGEPQTLEHKALRWITRQELADYSFCPADREILMKLGMLHV